MLQDDSIFLCCYPEAGDFFGLNGGGGCSVYICACVYMCATKTKLCSM